ncbi:TetR/AcrR family transcriptional regulator [Leisingera sp. ANG59]|uniref:TetR/AcrR family transcriptional regulator n=1 Tax=Leisingera sp. ANG59 TaxID=2675221 RepID=UPI001574BCE0|nr:TetR/AcrR family transcriptional regulator [Leisingera sp. ANG59]NSY41625.1 hypothetical protein [Leisingera sp. ANG59]
MTEAKTSPKRRQLRGEALKRRIIEETRKLVEEQGRSDKVSMKEIARRSGCSTTTLHRLEKDEELVSRTLMDFKIRLRKRDGRATVENLRDQIASLKDRIGALTTERDALLAQRADLFERILMSSTPVQALLRDDAVGLSTAEGACILCGGPPPSKSETNVVDISRQPRGRK